MIQVSILLQPQRTAVANFLPDKFGLFRRNPWQPIAEPRLKNTGIQWSNRECRPSVWSAAAESFNEICKVKARLRAVLQITSAKQYAPIHFILPHLKLNRTRRFNALAKEVQNTIDSKHKKRPTYYKDRMRPKQAITSNTEHICTTMLIRRRRLS